MYRREFSQKWSDNQPTDFLDIENTKNSNSIIESTNQSKYSFDENIITELNNLRFQRNDSAKSILTNNIEIYNFINCSINNIKNMKSKTTNITITEDLIKNKVSIQTINTLIQFIKKFSTEFNNNNNNNNNNNIIIINNNNNNNTINNNITQNNNENNLTILRDDQNIIKNIILETLQKEHSYKKDPTHNNPPLQKLFIIYGGPGCGKTFLINDIIKSAYLLYQVPSVTVATTGNNIITYYF